MIEINMNEIITFKIKMVKIIMEILNMVNLEMVELTMNKEIWLN